MELNADDLRESYKRHSVPKEKGDTPLNVSDFESIPEYLDNFDGVLAVNTYNGKTEIHIYKQLNDNFVRNLTVLSGERDSLIVTKLIGVSKEKFEEKYAKKIEKSTGSPRGLTVTTEDSNAATPPRHTAGALSDNSIHDSVENVKRESKFSYKRPAEGKVHKQIAEWEKLRVYEKVDAEKILYTVLSDVMTLSESETAVMTIEDRKAAENLMWEELNKALTPKEAQRSAERVAPRRVLALREIS